MAEIKTDDGKRKTYRGIIKQLKSLADSEERILRLKEE